MFLTLLCSALNTPNSALAPFGREGGHSKSRLGASHALPLRSQAPSRLRFASVTP